MARLFPPGCKKVNRNKLSPSSLQLIPLFGHHILPRVWTIPSTWPGLPEKSFPTACGAYPASFSPSFQTPFTPRFSSSVSFRPFMSPSDHHPHHCASAPSAPRSRTAEERKMEEKKRWKTPNLVDGSGRLQICGWGWKNRGFTDFWWQEQIRNPH